MCTATRAVHSCMHTRAGEIELTLTRTRTRTLTLALTLTLTSMRTRVGEVECDGEHAARQPIGQEHDLEQIAARSGTRARLGGWAAGLRAEGSSWVDGRKAGGARAAERDSAASCTPELRASSELPDVGDGLVLARRPPGEAVLERAGRLGRFLFGQEAVDQSRLARVLRTHEEQLALDAGDSIPFLILLQHLIRHQLEDVDRWRCRGGRRRGLLHRTLGASRQRENRGLADWRGVANTP